MPSSSPTAVIDTNVVLDMWVFRNPECAGLAAALLAGEICWIATAAMRAELAHVLVRAHLDVWKPDRPKLWSHWERNCVEVAAPTPVGAPGRVRCSDPDDQKFVDLAVARGARWLLSRDCALLRLAGRLRERGIEVVSPGGWVPPEPT